LTSSRFLPSVTVVTPSFNQGQFIEETILSVLTQDYPHIEYLVIDGGSTDNTLEILHRYGDRLTWISGPDHGQSHAINKGFRMAKGEILCWLNSDDIYEPGAISTAVNYLCMHPEVVMTYGLVKVISESGELTEVKNYSKAFDLWSVVHWAYGIDQASTFFRKSAIEEVGYLDEDLHWCMDWDLWVRMGVRFRMANLDTVFASIRMHSSAKTSTGGIQRLREIVRVMRKYSECSVAFVVLRAGLGSLHMLLKYRVPGIYRYLGRFIHYVKHYSLNCFYENFQGVYPDNWLGKKARFMFPIKAESDTIRFILELPDQKQLVPNSIRAMAAEKTMATLTMAAPGRYEFLLPYNSNATKPTEVELIFSRALPPDSQRRRLACKLVSVDFVP